VLQVLSLPAESHRAKKVIASFVYKTLLQKFRESHPLW